MPELLADIGIDGVLNSITTYAVKNASTYVGSALLSALPLALATEGAPSAWILGAGLSVDADLPSIGGGVTLNGTFDRVGSLSGSSSANFFSASGQFSTPRSSGSVGIPITLGVAWGLHNSSQYAGASLGVSVPFKSLPTKLQNSLFAGLSNAVADVGDASEIISQFNFPDLPDFAKNLGSDFAGEVSSFSAKLLSFLDRLEITAVTDSSFDYLALEVTANANFSAASGDSATGPQTGLSINAGYAWQLSPSGDVSL